MEKSQQSDQFDYRPFLEESAEELYENATCGYLSCLMDGTIVKVNRTLLSWLHYQPQELLQTKRFDSLLVMGSRIYYETHFAPLLRMQGSINEISLELLRQDRSYLPVLVNAVQVKAPNGEPVLHRYTLINITDRRLYEQELLLAKRKAEQMNQELAAVNEELAAASEEIQASNEELVTNNEELSVVNQQLEKVNADLDNFVYVASHDLKSPATSLAALVGFLHKRLEGKMDEQGQELLRMIEASSARLLRTIRDLTEVAKIQRNPEAEKETVFFTDLWQDIQADLQTLLLESGVQLHVDFQVDRFDYPRKNARSILYNLVSNALKYRSPDRLLHLSIGTQTREGKVMLQVKDNGLGLTHSQQTHLFTMFRRFHPHTEGSGIGLYMIKRMLENNGGTIQVESESAVGTKFVIQF